MDDAIVDKLDLRLAWQRLKFDRPDRAFYTHPQLIEWIELDLDGWLTLVKQRLVNSYVPHTSLVCTAPKPGWLIRPGSVLDQQDEVVFNALVGSLYKNAYGLLGPFQGDPDIAYQLKEDMTDRKWVRRGESVTRDWRAKSSQKLQTAQFMVTADIAGFYENIDLNRLGSDLKSLCPDQAFLTLLMSLLNKWAQPRGKGIPQGFSAADILAKIYLNPIDRALRNAGFTHLRYVDDIRIFCTSRLAAKSGLLLLNDLVRKRGLNLQSAKTKILRADEAVREIDGVTFLIKNIQSKLAEELNLDGDLSALSVAELERFFQEQPSHPQPEVLERAFFENFGTGTERFNKTLLHYLLTRLAKTKSRIAVEYAIAQLEQRPEETEYVLRYLAEAGVEEEDEIKIISYIASEEAIYDYQTYQIVAWFTQRNSYPKALVAMCRRFIADRNKDSWLRMAARSVLGRAGDQSDLEAIESSYEVASGDLERADIVAAMFRVETSRRNSFYGRVSGDCDLVQRAIKRVRTSSTLEVGA